MKEIRLEEPLGSPVFLLSCERSGSTLLRYIIDTHSEICCPGELMLGLLCQHLNVALLRTLGRALPGPNEKVTEVVTRRIVSGIMNAYARAKGKKIWCDKAPLNLMYLDALQTVFPDAKYICLYRNCLDVVYSCLEVSKHGFAFELAQYAARNPQNLVAAMIDSWVDKTTKLLLFELQNPSRCFRIKYESLVFNPAEVIPRLFYFLNVAWEPDILDRVFQTHHDQGGGDPKVIFTKKINPQYVGKGSAILLHFIPLEHLQRMNSLLKQLDYPQVGPDWNTSPSPYRPNNGSAETTQLLTTVREVFQTHVPARLRLNAELLKSTKASFRFVITGSQPCCWFVNLGGSHSQVVEGDHAADCTITTEDDVILGIANERLNAVTAYMDGKIKIQGRLELTTMVGIIL